MFTGVLWNLFKSMLNQSSMHKFKRLNSRKKLHFQDKNITLTVRPTDCYAVGLGVVYKTSDFSRLCEY